MAQIAYRINLSAAIFPPLDENMGQTIIANRIETLGKNASSGAPVEIESPQIAYAQNVMPTAYGYQSVAYAPEFTGYDRTAMPFFNPQGPFKVFENNNNAYLMLYDNGRLYRQIANVGPPGSPIPTPPFSWDFFQTIPTTGDVSVATLNNVTYLFISGTPGTIYQYDTSSQLFVVVAFIGISPSNVRKIFASNGYLLASTSNGVFNSSTVTPLDFTPSLITGAGGGLIQELRGNILNVQTTSFGFILFGAYNAVSAVYSGNLRYPYKYKEISLAGGMGVPAPEGNDDFVFALTTKGLQKVGKDSADIVFPEINAFLAGSSLDYFNISTFRFIRSYLTDHSSFVNDIHFVSSRYIVISYSVPALVVPANGMRTHCIVIDTMLQKIGMLRRYHTKVFENSFPSEKLVNALSSALCFLDFSSSASKMSYNIREIGSNGIALDPSGSMCMLGKLQLERGNLCSLQEVEFQNVEFGQNNFQLFDFSSLQGSEYDFVYAVGQENLPRTGGERQFRFRRSGTNHSLVFIGIFSLVSVIATLKNDARR